MPIVASDIKFYLSGGAANANPLLSLGGVMSSVEANPATLFDPISGLIAIAGQTDYRCVYIKNTHATLSLTATRPFILSTTGSNTSYSYGVSIEANGVMETFVLTNPTDVMAGSNLQTGFWASATTYSGTADAHIGDIAPGSFRALWIKRQVIAGASAGSRGLTMRIQGDSLP